MKRTTSVLASLLALLLIAAACGGDGDEDVGEPIVREEDGLTIAQDPGAASDEPGFLAIFVPEDLAGPVERLVDGFKEREGGLLFQITTGPRDLLQEGLGGDDAPNLYIDTPEELEQLDVETTGDPVELGSDVFQIAVARDNPRGVPGLEAFVAGEWTSGLCIPEVPCGALGRMILEAAGVQPAPELEADNGRSLVSAVANGEIDAGLALRTDIRQRFFRTSTVGVPPDLNITIDYAMGVIRSGDSVDRFVEFLESSEGDEALQRVGLRAFPAG